MKKVCRKCEVEQRVMDYYRHTKSADGFMSICKACHRANVSANYQRNREHYQEYERGRAMLPQRITLRDEYQKTDAGKAAVKRAKQKYDRSPAKAAATRRYRGKNPAKYAAHGAVNSALRDGRMTRQPCEACGKRAQAHHDDYSKPLDVRWLCTTHHAEWHKHNTPKCPDQERAA